MTEPDHDRDLDDLIRAASARNTDEAAMVRSVLERIDAAKARAGFFTLPTIGPNIAVAGFAAMLMVAGVAGYSLPDLTLGTPEEDFLRLAMGDPGTAAGPIISAVLEQSK